MSEFVLFDSSVLIDLWRSGRYRIRMESLSRLVCVSAVVLAELWRSADTKAEFVALQTLQQNHRVLSPTEKNWIESGQILAKIRHDHGFIAAKLRDLHLDVLISLTTRSYGATLVTSNRADFELIRTYRDFELEVW